MDQLKFKRLIKQIVAIIIVLIMIWIVWVAYYATTFHVISVSPSINNLSTITPYITVNFSKPIDSDKLSIKSSPSIIRSMKVRGKTAVLSLKIPLSTKVKYEIKIVSAYDYSGNELKNVSFVFTPQYKPYTALSSSQQQALLKQQDQAANNQPPSFLGTDALTAVGITTEQVQIFEQGVANFASSKGINLKSVSVESNSINSSGGQGYFETQFNFQMNNNTYQASMVFTGPQYAQLTINNTSGQQLYQYGSESGPNTTSTSSTTSGSQ